MGWAYGIIINTPTNKKFEGQMTKVDVSPIGCTPRDTVDAIKTLQC